MQLHPQYYYQQLPPQERLQPVTRLSGAGGDEGTPVSFMAVAFPILWHPGPLVKR